MLIGGFRVRRTSIDPLKSATEDRLAPCNRRPHRAAVAFYVIASWTRFGGEPDARQAEGAKVGEPTRDSSGSGDQGHVHLAARRSSSGIKVGAPRSESGRAWHVLPRGHVVTGLRRSE